jgi:hypothetical protein
MNPTNQIGTALSRLLDYCKKNNWAGYDPYDALNNELFKRLPFLDSRIPRLVLTQFLKRSPINFRNLLMIPKTQNPKALALFLKTFLKLSGDQKYDSENNIAMILERIKALRSPNTTYWCWGYSFPWQGRLVLAPRGEANLVCTVFVADALMDTYEHNQDANCLAIAASVAEYLGKLYWEDKNGDAGFSYPVPSIQTKVHNANFLAAALICRVYKYTREKKYLKPALNATRYSTGKQLEDGAWYYGEHEKGNWIDNFHTGYNLSALRTICRSLDSSEFETNIHRGFEFYITNFFTADNFPKYFHNKLYPIDIHAVAHSIITLVEFKDYNERAMGLAEKICQWAIENMQSKEGYFYYQKKKYYTNKISYMRWSQAWMLYAMTFILKTLQEKAD